MFFSGETKYQNEISASAFDAGRLSLHTVRHSDSYICKALEEEHDMAGRGGGSISSAVTAHITGGYYSKGGVQRQLSHAHQLCDCKGSERTVNLSQDVAVTLLLNVQLQPHRGSSGLTVFCFFQASEQIYMFAAKRIYVGLIMCSAHLSPRLLELCVVSA